MTNKLGITKQEFYDNFMEELSNKLGVKSYFNGDKLRLLGINPITSDILGVCQYRKKDAVVIIKYRKNKQAEMLGTLIHEYAHAILQASEDNKGYNPINEIEAETVAQNVLKYFSINDVTPNYIKDQKSKCSNYELEKYYNSDRMILVEGLSNKIIDILSSKKEIIKKLNNEKNTKTIYKYGIQCPCCNKVIGRYKRKTDAIKTNAKGYYCKTCTKEKTLDRLTVLYY